MVWLVDPGEQAYQEEDVERSTAERKKAPGTATGVNMPPAFTPLVYGIYESQEDAEQALGDISGTLLQGASLRITMHGGRTFLVPASRVHYVVWVPAVSVGGLRRSYPGTPGHPDIAGGSTAIRTDTPKRFGDHGRRATAGLERKGARGTAVW